MEWICEVWSRGMLQKVKYQSPIFRRDAGWKGLGCWVEISQQSRGCWVEILDAGWKQNIANKYSATLNVNSLHINIVRHIWVKLSKSSLLLFIGTPKWPLHTRRTQMHGYFQWRFVEMENIWPVWVIWSYRWSYIHVGSQYIHMFLMGENIMCHWFSRLYNCHTNVNVQNNCQFSIGLFPLKWWSDLSGL